jgi:hypothetical protein
MIKFYYDGLPDGEYKPAFLSLAFNISLEIIKSKTFSDIKINKPE